MQTITPREAAIRIRKLPSELQNVERNAGRRGARKLRSAALARFMGTGIGRSIFGETAKRRRAGAKALRAIFPTPRVESRAEGQIRISYQLRGTAALVDTGGKTSRHVIKPSGGEGVMKIAIPGGPTIYRTFPRSGGSPGRLRRLLVGRGGGDPRGIDHPGARMPRQPFLDDSGQETLAFLETELEAAYQKASDETVG